MTQAAAAAETEPTPLATTAAPKKRAGGGLTKLRARATEDHRGKGGQLRRRRMRIIVDKRLCDPGAFDDDIELIIVSASTEVELESMKACGDNAGGIMFEMVKRCMVSCDGEPVLEGQGDRDLLWEALGTAGRSLLVRKWNELCGHADPEALKKADSSTQLLV